jgi:hypothetical protein
MGWRALARRRTMKGRARVGFESRCSTPKKPLEANGQRRHHARHPSSVESMGMQRVPANLEPEPTAFHRAPRRGLERSLAMQRYNQQ